MRQDTSSFRPTPPLRFVLIGAGCVGTAVCELLRRRGHTVVGVSSRSSASTKSAAARLGASPFDHRIDLPTTDVVLLGVPDGAIKEVTATVAPRLGDDHVVVHFAGSFGITPLAFAVETGAKVAALHPVQTCPDVDTAVARLPGSSWGVTASEGLEKWAASLIHELDGIAVTVGEGSRPVWHAASVIASNGVAALLATAEALLESVDVERPETVLGPLAAGALANARSGGGGAATLTGPVARGESAVVARHMVHLTEESPTLAADYARVARVIVAAARRAKRIDERVAREVLDVLEDASR